MLLGLRATNTRKPLFLGNTHGNPMIYPTKVSESPFGGLESHPKTASALQ
jgi:hypothetical protein